MQTRVKNALKGLNKNTIRYDGLDVAIIDQLTDLQHLCESKKISFYDVLQTAYCHYVEERKDGKD
jgi:hypothetical protein